MCLYKFTHIPLLKNNTLLKQKSDKKTITQIYQEIKIIFRKKITFKQKKKSQKKAKEKKEKKKEKQLDEACLENQKKKKKKNKKKKK